MWWYLLDIGIVRPKELLNGTLVLLWNWMLSSGRGSVCRRVPPQRFIPPLIIPQPSAAPQWSDTRALRLIQYTHGDDNARWWIRLRATEINGQPIKTVSRVGNVCFWIVVQITRSDSLHEYYIVSYCGNVTFWLVQYITYIRFLASQSWISSEMSWWKWAVSF